MNREDARALDDALRALLGPRQAPPVGRHLPPIDADAADWCAELALAVPELAGIAAARAAADYDAADHDASLLLHAFAGPACILRALLPHPGASGPPEQAAARAVWYRPETLVGLHAIVRSAEPTSEAERLSPWLDGGVWCVSPAPDGTDPRVEAALRLAGSSGSIGTDPTGCVVGDDPIVPVLGWLLGRGRRLAEGSGCLWPNRAWVGEGPASLIPRAQLRGRDYRDPRQWLAP